MSARGGHPRFPAFVAMAVVLAVAGLGGCMRSTGTEMPRPEAPPDGKRKSEKGAQDAPRADPLAELRTLETIPDLWNAQNQAQDRLGQALSRLERPGRYRVDEDGKTGPTPKAPAPRLGVATEAPPADRWSTRDAQTTLCREACRHVAAICFASRRICSIAGRLREWASRQACARAEDRCQEAHRAVRTRCARCPRP